MNKITSEMTGETIKGSSAPKYFIEKPTYPDSIRDDFFSIMNDPESRKYYDQSTSPNYIAWDKFRHKIGTNKKFSPEQIWFYVRQLRKFSSRPTVLKAETGDYFNWNKLPAMEASLHRIDMFAGGRLFNETDKLSSSKNHTYLSRGLLEEAIASSQLEGAHTTRKAAREMLIQNREPKNESEQMIVNNFKTISRIQEDFKDRKLDLDLLYEIHAMISDGTVPKDEQHRLRKDSDNIVVQGIIGGEEYIAHVPPSEKFLSENIQVLIDYANNDDESQFTHPIIKAILIHFWIGYLHPFTDGNGRLARALFYWYLLRKGYWTFMYLPISTIIKRNPNQYAMAYIYSEQDDLDMTYFFDFHIRKVLLAIKDFEEYLDGKIDENKLIESSVSRKYTLNDRQKQLIYYLVSDESPSVSVGSHTTLHSITRQTASKDLRALEEYGLIESKRAGRLIKFYPTQKLLDETKTF